MTINRVTPFTSVEDPAMKGDSDLDWYRETGRVCCTGRFSEQYDECSAIGAAD